MTYTLPPCTHEGTSHCFWDAPARGMDGPAYFTYDNWQVAIASPDGLHIVSVDVTADPEGGIPAYSVNYAADVPVTLPDAAPEAPYAPVSVDIAVPAAIILTALVIAAVGILAAWRSRKAAQ